MTVPDAIKAMDRGFTTDDILDALPDAKLPTVQQALWRMTRDDQIIPVAVGVYATPRRFGEVAAMVIPSPDDQVVKSFLEIESILGVKIEERGLASRLMDLILKSRYVE